MHHPVTINEPSKEPNWKARAVSAADAVSIVKSGNNVFVHGACATPLPLVDALAARADLQNVSVYHLHTSGSAPYAASGKQDQFRSVSFFVGANVRKAIEEGRADYLPVFLSDIPGLLTSRQISLDVALLQLSPPDRHGNCSLGTSVDAAHAAFESAHTVVAEINEQMPRTHGATTVPLSRLSAFVHTDRPLQESERVVPTEVDRQIAKRVAALVEDGSTLQMGIGAVPDATLALLKNKLDLGIHTEMFSDGLVELVASGAVTNRHKQIYPGRSVTSFVSGSKRVFDYVHENPAVEFLPCNLTNDPAAIAQNPKVVAINSALQIDLTGQVCADSIGHRIYSGVGGQVDFLRGAALSMGGKPILAFPATAARGTISRIVPALETGAGVVTSRGHVHWVVTEYGAVNLHGQTLRQRGEALISLAHPDFRADLRSQFSAIRHYAVS